MEEDTEEQRKAAAHAKRERQSARELRARIESVRGIDVKRSARDIEAEAEKYQRSHEHMVTAKAREQNRDIAMKRMQGLDGSVKPPPEQWNFASRRRGDQVLRLGTVPPRRAR
jgi:hypothetical protein